jgi:M6 family metalloprotease-like protein
MTRCTLRLFPLVGLTLLAAALWGAAESPQLQPAPVPELAEYRTVYNAVTAKIVKATGPESAVAGYLGVSVAMNADNRLVVEEIQPDSPGDKAGIKTGDQVVMIGNHLVATPIAFREWLLNYPPGEAVKLALFRDGQNLEVTAKLAPISRPMTKGQAPQKAADGDKGEKAEKGAKGEGGGKGGKGGAGKGGGFAGGKGNFALPLWTKPAMRLAVVPIDFPDYKHNEKITLQDWDESIFSTGQYANKTNATGQSVFGSLNDYILEQSGSTFHIQGKVFDWTRAEKKRGEYAPGNGTNNKTAVLLEALGKAASRDGKDSFKDFDGFIFLYAGDSPQKTNQGNVYFPHAGSLTFNEKRYTYMFTNEGATRMTPVGGFVKLLGMALGLPDLAAKKEQGGYRGLGNWCALSAPLIESRPQHFSAWAKEKIGWIQPAVIDPTVKQKLILGPIEDSPRECYKVLLRPNGSEYYLLENRRKKGFDGSLPAEGLLIYRVHNDRPILCEAHGIDSPTGPTIQLASVPFPTEGNSAFTPDTTPSSRSPLGGGLPVYISEIRRLPDGRITFSIGYEYR